MKDPWPEVDICVGGVDKGSALAAFLTHPEVLSYLRVTRIEPSRHVAVFGDAAKLPDRATQLAKDMAETLAAANANFERQSTGRQRQYILPKIGSDLGPVVTDADMGRPCSTWSLCLMSPRGGSGGSPPRSPI